MSVKASQNTVTTWLFVQHLFKLATNKIPKVRIIGSLWGKPVADSSEEGPEESIVLSRHQYGI